MVFGASIFKYIRLIDIDAAYNVHWHCISTDTTCLTLFHSECYRAKSYVSAGYL